jgi:hypothetical protein
MISKKARNWREKWREKLEIAAKSGANYEVYLHR